MKRRYIKLYLLFFFIFRDLLLTIKKLLIMAKEINFKLNPAKTNTVLVMVNWDMNDADYNTKTASFDAEKFFKNKKLLLALSYVSRNGDEIASDLESGLLCDELDESELEDCMETCPCFPMLQVLNDNELVARNENCEPGHSVDKVSAIYINETGQAFSIDFSEVTDGWTRESINEFILND